MNAASVEIDMSPIIKKLPKDALAALRREAVRRKEPLERLVLESAVKTAKEIAAREKAPRVTA